MLSKEITVQHQDMMSPKISTMLLQKAYEFKSHIWIQKEENRADARSLLDILSLGIQNGTKISIIADGMDEQEAVSSLAQIAENCFA